jgi:hypothetical protein
MPIPLGSRPYDRSRSSRLVFGEACASFLAKLALRQEQLVRSDTDLERPACFGSFRRRAVKQPAGSKRRLHAPRLSSSCDPATLGARRLRIARDVAVTIESRSDPSSSRCQISRTRIAAALASTTLASGGCGIVFSANEHSRLVEPDGIEPTTSCLQSRRSPN